MGEHFPGSQETLSYLEGFPYLDLASPTYKMRKWRWDSWVSVVKGDVLWGLFRALSNPLSTYERDSPAEPQDIMYICHNNNQKQPRRSVSLLQPRPPVSSCLGVMNLATGVITHAPSDLPNTDLSERQCCGLRRPIKRLGIPFLWPSLRITEPW